MPTTPIPGAPTYMSAVELAKKRYQTRLADINQQRQRTMRQAGFMGDIDPTTGLVSNMRTDPYNQYGQYQQLNRAQSFRSDEMYGQNFGRGLSSRGGLGRQNIGNLRYEFGKEDSDFGANLLDQMSSFTRQQEEEKFSYDEALYRAQQEAAAAAIGAGDFGSEGGDPGYENPGYDPATGGQSASLPPGYGSMFGASKPVFGNRTSQQIIRSVIKRPSFKRGQRRGPKRPNRISGYQR